MAKKMGPWRLPGGHSWPISIIIITVVIIIISSIIIIIISIIVSIIIIIIVLFGASGLDLGVSGGFLEPFPRLGSEMGKTGPLYASWDHFLA